MAVLSATALTLADWAKRMDDEYKTATIVELLSQTNEILDDMLWVQGNLPTGFKTTVRTGLPSGTWRLLNYGVQKVKSTTAQITDTCGNLEAYTEVDKDIADLNGNSASFRMSESMATMEGMSQQVAQAIFYGNVLVNPERFMGLAPRYNTVSTATAQTAANVIDAGGTGSTNTSIWIVTWGAQTMHGIFPMGKLSGLQHENLGRWTASDAAGGYYEVYRDHFKWECGMTVRDWRYAVRICNIDVTTLLSGSAPNLVNYLIRGIHRLPTTSRRATQVQKTDAPSIQGEMGRTVIYCNKIIATHLDIQAVNKANVLLKIEEWEGMAVTTFRGIPIRICDAIVNTEARVV